MRNASKKGERGRGRHDRAREQGLRGKASQGKPNERPEEEENGGEKEAEPPPENGAVGNGGTENNATRQTAADNPTALAVRVRPLPEGGARKPPGGRMGTSSRAKHGTPPKAKLPQAGRVHRQQGT